MLIYSVRLENFKSYESATVTFALGTNAIVGNNGAGKSTLLEAIGFALFDYVPTARQSDLLREGVASGSVVVTFCSSLDDRRYEVERQFARTGTTRHRIYDSEGGRQVLAESVGEVREWIHEHLGIDRDANLDDLFRNTIGVPQGSFTAPFLLAAGERRRMFDPLLQVDEYDLAYQNLRETDRYLVDQRTSLQRDIARLEGLLAQLPGLMLESQGLQLEISDLRESAGKLEEALVEARTELRRLDAAQREVSSVEQARSRNTLQLQAAEGNRATAGRSVTEAQQATERLLRSEAGYRAYLSQEAQRAALDQDRTTRDGANRELERLRVDHTRVQARLEQVQRALDEIEQAMYELETLRPQVIAQQQLQHALDEARAEERVLGETRRQLATLTVELASLETQLANVDAALAQGPGLEAELARQDASLAAMETHERQLVDQRSSLQAELGRLHEQAVTLEKAHSAQCPVCEGPLTPEHRLQLLGRNTEQTQELSARLNNVIRDMRDLSVQRDESRRLRADVEQRLRKLPAPAQRDGVKETLEARRVAAAALERRIAEALAAAQQMPVLTGQLAALGDPATRARVLESRIAEEAKRRAESLQLQEQESQISANSDQWLDQLARFVHLDEALAEVAAALSRTRRDHDLHLSSQQVAGHLDERRRTLAEIGQSVADLTEQAEALTAEFERVSQAYDAGEHERVRQHVEQTSAEAVRARTQLTSQEERLGTVSQQIAALEGEQARLEERHAEAERVAALERTLEEIRGLLHAAGPYVTRQLVANISTQASTFYCDIMNDYTGRLVWSEDYELSLEVKGRARSFQQLSGGEQMSAALALRLALLRQLSNINVAFFDEPTAHLDPERRDGLAEKIMQVKGFDQLFVISHDDTFERAAQNYIRIEKRDNVSMVVEHQRC
jgi:exonuclease SbcC